MAHTAATSWECRATGTLTGGAGFDPSFGGTDYSQQDAPQLTHTDGVIAATNLQSTLGGFTAAMKGNSVYLSVSDTWRQITAFVDANNVTLDSAPGNSSGNTYNVGGAFLNSVTALRFPWQPGNVIWWRGSANPTNAAPSITSTDATKPVSLKGYGTTRGDAGYGTVLGGATAAPTFSIGSNSVCSQMIFDGQSSQARAGIQFTGADSTVFNCIVRHNASTANGVEILGGYNTLKDCFIDVSTTSGSAVVVGTVANPASGCTLEHNVLRGNATGSGILCQAGSFANLHHNVIFGASGGAGIGFTAGGSNWSKGAYVGFNDLWGNKYGIQIQNVVDQAPPFHIEGNIFGSNSTNDLLFSGTDISAGLAAADWAKLCIDNNAFYSSVTRYAGVPAGNHDLTLSQVPFVDPTTTFNFQLNNVAGGGLPCQGYWTYTNPDGVNVASYNLGALGGPPAAIPPVVTPVTAALAPSIDQVLFPVDLSRGAAGGPAWRTIVVGSASGREQRVQQWADPRAEWTISADQLDPTRYALVRAFWYARAGRARGFRLHLQDDYIATNEALYPAAQNAANPVKGAPTVQLVKSYGDAGNTYVRNLYAPVASPAVTLRKNGSNLPYTSIDTTTGLVSLTALATQAITGISVAAAAIIAFGSTPVFVMGDLLALSGIVGMTAANGLVVQVTSVGAFTVTTSLNSSGFATYVSGGAATKYAAAGDSFDWSGQFDMPVRFDSDAPGIENADVGIKNFGSIRVIELKG